MSLIVISFLKYCVLLQHRFTASDLKWKGANEKVPSTALSESAPRLDSNLVQKYTKNNGDVQAIMPTRRLEPVCTIARSQLNNEEKLTGLHFFLSPFAIHEQIAEYQMSHIFLERQHQYEYLLSIYLILALTRGKPALNQRPNAYAGSIDKLGYHSSLILVSVSE